jgi:VIT1/CCC1 family predicted Fe2+/Mn2+ transporter
MSKLGELHREEKEAQQELEKAEKEAQKIRMSIPDLLNSQNDERDKQMNRITLAAEAEVEKKIIELSNSLRGETEDLLNQLAGKEEILEKAATASLREYIMSSGSSGR